MLKTKPSGKLELLPSFHPGSMGLWDPGGQRSLGGRVRFPCGLSSLSPKGPGGATPRLHSLLGLALAMPSASPRPGTAVLPLASRHHSWAGRGGRRARSLQLRREPFLAGATHPLDFPVAQSPGSRPPTPASIGCARIALSSHRLPGPPPPLASSGPASPCWPWLRGVCEWLRVAAATLDPAQRGCDPSASSGF